MTATSSSVGIETTIEVKYMQQRGPTSPLREGITATSSSIGIERTVEAEYM